MPTADVYVLVAPEENEVKIGCSRNPHKRRQELMSSRHVQLDLVAWLPGGFGAERTLHQRFAEYRIHGEWFDASPVLMKWVHDLRVEMARALAVKIETRRNRKCASLEKAA